MIKFENPQTTYVLADPHFFHQNIITKLSTWSSGGQREDDSIDDMNNRLWKSINDKVSEDSNLIINGDFSFGGPDKIRAARAGIKCKNIWLIAGNHDSHILKKPELQSLFTAVYGSIQYDVSVHFRIGQYDYMISHYASRTWRGQGDKFRHIFGHSHGHLVGDSYSLSIDAGFDVHKQPLSFEEVEKLISKKTYKSVDHH
jgi:calcineurin-like phosphoesterase family protein